MRSTPQEVMSQLQQQQYAPVYFLHGEESYYIDLITNYVSNHVLTEAEKGFNQVVVYGKDHDVGQVLTHARRFPMGSQHQVVLVKEAQELSDLYKDTGCKLLTAYLQSPQPATLLVFAHKHKALDARTTVSKALHEHAVVVHSPRIYENRVPQWIRTYVQAQGMTITEKSIFMLQEHVGSDLTRLAGELQKIRINLGDTIGIDDAAVQTYVGISKTFNAFELQKAIARRDSTKAQQIIRHLAANPKLNPAIPIVALLYTFFSKLLLVHHAKVSSEEALAKILQTNAYFVGEYVLAARYYPLAKTAQNIHYLHEADLRLKGVEYPATPEEQLLKELVFKLMHKC
ncbi:MAG: DNA polymerase III subunit delta [Bacteroidota bacterium]